MWSYWMDVGPGRLPAEGTIGRRALLLEIGTGGLKLPARSIVYLLESQEPL
jgi:hypothetical protein